MSKHSRKDVSGISAASFMMTAQQNTIINADFTSGKINQVKLRKWEAYILKYSGSKYCFVLSAQTWKLEWKKLSHITQWWKLFIEGYVQT